MDSKTVARRFTRRTAIKSGVLIAGAAGVSGVIAIPQLIGPPVLSNLGDLDFRNELAIPLLAASTVDRGGRRVFDLRLQTGETAIVPGAPTATWGVNGTFLGPTLRAKRGETVAFNIENHLPETSTLHWHGMHLPAAMDGGPHQPIVSGGYWGPAWTIDQPAATLWYHPHPHGQTAEHVYRGIAGLFLIDDDETEALDLPSEYGVDDVPLIVQDKRMTGDGQFSFDASSFVDGLRGAGSFGILGDAILVNGSYNPHFTVRRDRLRLRLLNGSNARFYNFGLTDNRSFRLLATDSGLIGGAPAVFERLMLGPGERAEILIEFTPRDEVILRSFAQDLESSRLVRRRLGADDTFDILAFRALDRLETVASGEGSIPPDDPAVPEGATTRSFRLEGHRQINGKTMDMSRIDLAIPAGAIEIWEISSSAQPHTFHIHGTTFRVLEVNGEEPPSHLRGPKDTVFVSKGHPVRLAVQFGAAIDPGKPFMYHCHLLRHEDNGMMGQFVVVEPGTEHDTPMTIPTEDHH